MLNETPKPDPELPSYNAGITGQNPHCEGFVHVYAPGKEPVFHDDLCGTWDEVMADIHAIVHGEQPKRRA